ncbi:MAG: GAF domain-containing protein [Colwellia sp.]|nr:GAF domain-containing protein [Colwellia sp.]
MDPITELTEKLTNPTISVDNKLIEICQRTHQLIEGADRISLWSFSQGLNKITSLLSFDTNSGQFTSGQELSRDDYTEYFDAIIKNEVINAPRARDHVFTQCFNESYFEPLKIYSLLDFILHNDFKPMGIICCEGVGKVKYWSGENIETLKRIANISSCCFQQGT